MKITHQMIVRSKYLMTLILTNVTTMYFVERGDI